MTDPFVNRDWIQSHPEAVILDARYYLDEREGRDAYLAGHIPGARFVDMDADLAGPAGAAGRHPLPEPGVFSAAMRRVGVSSDSVVAVYDDAAGFIAGRCWWMLDSVGVDAYLLDGGIDAWPGPIEPGEEVPTSEVGTLRVEEWPPDRFVHADYVAGIGEQAKVIDSRSIERYRGEPSPLDPRAGHIPGALGLPSTDNLTEGQALPSAAVAARFHDAGISSNDEVVAYCGSGVSACLNLAALTRAGYTNLKLYTGSWSEWAADPSRPIDV